MTLALSVLGARLLLIPLAIVWIAMMRHFGRWLIGYGTGMRGRLRGKGPPEQAHAPASAKASNPFGET